MVSTTSVECLQLKYIIWVIDIFLAFVNIVGLLNIIVNELIINSSVPWICWYHCPKGYLHYLFIYLFYLVNTTTMHHLLFDWVMHGISFLLELNMQLHYNCMNVDIGECCLVIYFVISSGREGIYEPVFWPFDQQ